MRRNEESYYIILFFAKFIFLFYRNEQSSGIIGGTLIQLANFLSEASRKLFKRDSLRRIAMHVSYIEIVVFNYVPKREIR